ncbi:MFS transporter [Pseudoclavibacter endophyticus]|nr:MFS transporter [Pseudoclavibacter endophyticus]
MWDIGNSAWQAIVVTFVFATYLASDLFIDPDLVELGRADPQNPLYLAGQANTTMLIANLDAIAAVIVAIISPALGARSDGSGTRKRWLLVFTVLTIATMLTMYFVLPDQSFLLFGAALLAVGVVFSEFSGVSYDAMLAQVSTKKTVGRTSGIGWGSGYLASIVLLVLLLLLFIQDFGVEGAAGMLNVPTGAEGDGLNIRLAILVAAIWLALFSIPIFLRVPETAKKPARAAIPWWKTYAVLWRTIARIGRTEPKLLLFLLSSAIFRDGLAAVFGFGAIMAAQVYGFSSSEVIYFAVAANLVAGLGTVAAGWFDDRFSPKVVVIVSLVSLVAVASLLFFLPTAQVVFWTFGLFLCLFVGPVQSASRSYLMRSTPVGHEGELFGLYRLTGRAASFLTPALIGVLLAATGDPKVTIVAIGIVLLVGLLVFLPVRSHPTQVVIEGERVAVAQITLDGESSASRAEGLGADETGATGPDAGGPTRQS